MIIVTGATGQLGHAIVEHLIERVGAEQIGVSVRDPHKAQAFADRGVRVRQGDFGDPASLAHAFEGATRVLIMSSGALGDAGVQLHGAAIDAAKEAGARRILYTSHMGSSATSHFDPMTTHAATEALLQASGVPYTSLRNGFYTSTVLMLLGNAQTTGELAAPEDGPVSWTTHADLAQAAAVILSGATFDGPTPALTASEALDAEAIAVIASEVVGRPIRRVVVSDQEHRDRMVANGVPEARADMLIGMFKASRAGEFAKVDPTLAQLVNRPTISVRDFLAGTLNPNT